MFIKGLSIFRGMGIEDVRDSGWKIEKNIDSFSLLGYVLWY